MAAITTDALFTVRSITTDGEFIAETEAMDEGAAMATFDDTLENSGEGVTVQLIHEDGSIVTEEHTAA
jgi:hypothetical protein